MISDKMSNVFAALSQGSRLSVFRLLIEYGEEGLCASDISKKLKITKNTLSFHLLLLVNAGLLNKKREGTFIFYSANYKTVQEVIDFLIENCCRKTKDHKHKHRPLKALGQKAAKG